MTPKQRTLYWRTWAAAKRALSRLGYDTAEADAMRADLTIQALGKQVSSKALTNAQFDLVLAAFRAVSDPGDLDAQLRAMLQPRDRILWSLRHNHLPRMREALDAADIDERYLQRIARQALRLDHDPDLATLDEAQLLIILRAARIHCQRLVDRGQKPVLHSRPCGDILVPA